MKQPSAGLLVFAEGTGRILLLRRSRWVANPGYWSMPAGRIDPGETPLSAAVREFVEEAGVPPDGISVSPEGLYDPGGTRERRRPFFTYRGVVPSEFEPQLNWENDDWGWFGAGFLPRPLHPGFGSALRSLGVR